MVHFRYDYQVWQFSECKNAQNDLKESLKDYNRMVQMIFAKPASEKMIIHDEDYYQTQGYNNY